MRKLVKWLCLPILASVGLALIGPQDADAARWRRHARWHGYAPYYPVAPPVVAAPYYVAPPIVHAPSVGVVVPAPRVHVGVGPGVHVRVPGVGVHIGPLYRPYYWGPRYHIGW